MFENIECEWPLFFCYYIIDACFRGDREIVSIFFSFPLNLNKTIYQDCFLFYIKHWTLFYIKFGSHKLFLTTLESVIK